MPISVSFNFAQPIPPVEQTLSESGTSNAFAAQMGRQVHLTLRGTWSGSVTVEKSHDGGASWSAITILGQPIVYSTNCEEPFDEPASSAVQYRAAFSGSGSISIRLGH